MANIPGARPPQLSELVRASDRISFHYVEHCVVHRDSNAILVKDDSGVVPIPAASLGTLLLGPGTRVTHHAMMLLGESGSTAIWVGERGVRYYAHGRGLSESTRLLEAQADAVTHRDKRLAVARAMYAMRFPGEDTSELNMKQLRGREGARVRQIYREASVRSGVDWKKRSYDSKDWSAGDPINQAISAANTCLYGAAHAVIVALGCSPGLGFVHTGHSRAFVYDIADLYKMEVAVQIAFDVVADEPDDIGGATRRAVRDELHRQKILDRMSVDIRSLLIPDDAEDTVDNSNVIYLWDDKEAPVAGGVAYDDEYEVDW